MTKSISKVFNGGKVSGRGTAYVSISPGLSNKVILPTCVYKEGRECNATYSSDQSPFSQDVRKNCFDRCVVTGAQSRWRTEAAHITPRHEECIPDFTNGLLLCRDIHTLFDHNHCAIDPDNMKVYCAIDEDLLEWQGSTIIASRMQTHINIEYLRPRWSKFIEIHGKMMA
nr:HNH endonuclease signature motif containing protein [Hafnia paralvei]